MPTLQRLVASLCAVAAFASVDVSVEQPTLAPMSPPRPDPVKGAPNIIFVLTDDQDLLLGSMAAMPYTRANLLVKGANMTNFFVNTPICCPSRAVLLSGRMNHNNKADHLTTGGVVGNGMCMRMNTSQNLNPAFWQNSFINQLYYKYGYTTGAFGKILNEMRDYGCNGKSKTEGLDRMFVMCKHVFYDEEWIDQGAPDSPKDFSTNSTGEKPEEYTTSLVGNATLRWIRSVVEQGSGRRPFFAWVGPHAPHLPATPASWYLDHPVGNISFPREAYWGYLGSDKHAFFPEESENTPNDAETIQNEYSKRLRSLLSVDDMIRDIREYLVKAGEWDNTYFFFSSDHGYSLGQFRVLSHKMQVYDHNTCVPFIITGPKIKEGHQLSVPTSMVDVGPTILELAGATGSPSEMDGHSFAPQLLGKARPAAFPRDAVLIEYQSIKDRSSWTSCEDETDQESKKECISAYGYHEGYATPKGTHIVDGPNNTFSAIRIFGNEGDLLYAEFADVSDPDAYFFAPEKINFWELYNFSDDRYMLKNIYSSASKSLKKSLHERLQLAIKCAGRDSCTKTLGDSASLLEPIVV